MKQTIIFALMVTLFWAPVASAADSGRALIIGVQRYEKADELAFVDDDVRLLCEVLSDRCGFAVDQVIDSDLGDSVGRIGPTTHRDGLMKKITMWVDGMTSADSAVLYISGHGFIARDGKLYLASLNCDPADPVPGGVSVAWLREQLARCPARCKVLLLDACHSGSSKAFAGKPATAKAFEVEMRKLGDVVTLASCRGEERSYLWPAKRNSLFTFWLAEGLKGHADIDANRRVTMSELTDYVTRNVSRTATTLNHDQTPIVLGGDDAVAELAFLPKLISLKRLLFDMAENLDTLMRRKDLDRLGVPEFAVGESGDRLDDGSYGTLPAYLSNELTEQLTRLSDGDYDIISGPALREALADKGLGPKDLGTSKTVGLDADGLSVPALAVGRIRVRDGGTIRLGCQMQNTVKRSQLGSANGSAFLNESEWAMLGQSAQAPDTETWPTPEAWDEQARKPHPMLDPNCPFRVSLWVKDSQGTFRKREGTVRGSDYVVTLTSGEIYQIRIDTKHPDDVFLRLLVDGLNTLPHRMKTREKGVVIERVEGQGEIQVAPRVNLTEAHAWHLKAADADSTRRGVINGFYRRTGSEGRYNAFEVTDAPESAAARQGYTEQIGLITAAFYEAYEPSVPLSKGPRSASPIGTKLGPEYAGATRTYTGGKQPGRLLTVLHIRYESPPVR